MKHFFTTTALIGLALAFVAGCDDTAKGMAQDTKENASQAAQMTEAAGDQVKKTADQASEKAKEVGNDIGEATLGAKIKTALMANPITNKSELDINVDSNDSTVVLNGTVATSEQKAEAEQIARQVMKDNKADQSLENKLEIKS